MAETSVRKCACFHPYQDERYGGGSRVFNQTKDGWECTVCGRSQTDAKAAADRAKK